MVKVGKWIARHRVLMLIVGFLLIIPSVIGMAKTRVNYDLLSYLPEHLETVKGQDILVDEYGMGAFSMVVVENMDLKDVQKLEEKFENVSHVKDVLWYDDVADISLPVEMIPSNLREAFFKGDATMMLVLFDNTTSSDDSMDAVGEMRKIANEQCFISGMTGVVADIKNLALKELPIYVVIAALLSLIVLELTSGSFVVPILFLLSIGLAILYNLGSNVFLVGDVVETEDFKITFVSAGKYKSDNEYITPKKGYEYWQFKFKFENTSDTDQNVSTMMDWECYADNSKADQQWIGDDSGLDATLSAGRQTEGTVYFEVPKDSKHIELEYDINYWQDNKIVFVGK